MNKIRFIETALASSLLLLTALIVVPQSISPPQPAAVLEIVHEGQLAGGWQSFTTRFFADGRVLNEGKLKRKAKSGRYIDILSRVETRLEASELAELMSLVERPDFLNAEASYTLRVVQDNPDLTTITFRKDGLEKRVLIGNYLISTEAEKTKLPPTLSKVLEWVRKALLD